MKRIALEMLTTRRRSLVAPALLVAAALAGPAPAATDRPSTSVPVPESAGKMVELPPVAAPTPRSMEAIPERLLQAGATFTLADVVEIALANNPLTRTSYLEARSAAANLGSK